MVRQQIALILCFVFILPFMTAGQYRLSIQYSHHSPAAQSSIQKVKFKKHYKTPVAVERDLHKLVSQLHHSGFSSAALDSLYSEGTTFFAELYVGEKITISHITIQGLDEDEIHTMKIKPALSKQSSFSMEAIFSYNDKIAAHLWNTGYPFATTKMSELTDSDSGYVALIAVEKNNFIVLDSIITIGKLKIGKSFLYGYLGLKRQKPYNESIMKQVPLRIQELEFAEAVKSPGISFSENLAALYIYANKRKTNQFDGYFGIVPNDEVSGKVLLTGSITLDLNNVLTVGEHLKFNWKQLHTLTQNMDIYADFPYLFYSSFGIDGQFVLEKKDTSYINLNFSAGVRYYLGQRNYVRAYYQFKNSRLINTASLEDLIQLDNVDYNLHSYGLEIQFHKLDYLFNPRKGYSFSFSAAMGQRNFIKNNNIADSLYDELSMSSMQLQFGGLFDFYIPIKKHWGWYISTKAGHIQASHLFQNELFRLGGLKTLRGFDEQALYASTYCILNNELRFIFGRKSYLQVFFDAAWYEQKLNNTYLSDTPFGFGVGISFDTKAGIFAFNYALGKQLNNPIRFDNGKITFGYTVLF